MRNLYKVAGCNWPYARPNATYDIPIGIECEYLSPNANITINTKSVASGSMLILALAYVQKSGDRSLISRYYPRLLKWANYLVKNTLVEDLPSLWVPNLRSTYIFFFKFMTHSITTDGSHSAMSNLALKGITGIYAMGKINQLLEGYVYGAETTRTSYYLASFLCSSLIHHSLTFLTNML